MFTFWALDTAFSLALSIPSWMAVNTALSWLSKTSEILLAVEPKAEINWTASGVSSSVGSWVSRSTTH